jgi:3D (Asp-Asp-Asp) domain-containing protein
MAKKRHRGALWGIGVFGALLVAVSFAIARPISMEVTASAFNARVEQTDSAPRETACQTKLQPGMKVVAVSRDLFKNGLVCGTKVKIEGLEGEYIVHDKMDDRWEKRIDIYMDNDVARAKEWGEKKVTIRFEPSQK